MTVGSHDPFTAVGMTVVSPRGQNASRKGIGMRKSHFAARRGMGRVDKEMATYPTAGSGQEVAATKGGKKDGALKGRRYDRKFKERARCIVPLRGQIRRVGTAVLVLQKERV